MIAHAAVLFWVLLALAAAQALLVPRFVWRLSRSRRIPAPDHQCPKASAILCLRGPDPFLASCLEGILDQDYPCYDVRIVVDSLDDPARQTVDEVLQRRGVEHLCSGLRKKTGRSGDCEAAEAAGAGVQSIDVQPLTARRDSCSLKCSSLLQAIAGLDDSCQVVALLDADTVPHRTWLRELVAPLCDPRVGAATGNRWYMPSVLSWGSLVRYLWNAAAVVQMLWYHIPWGGTLALKTAVLREAGLLERWGRSFCEDTMLYRLLRQQGYQVAFVPSLVMINREGCGIPGFFGWVRRQLLTARLYHPAWPLVAGHGLGIFVGQLVALIMLIVALAQGDWTAAGWLAAGLGAYWGIMVVLIIALEWSVRHIPRARGEPSEWLSFRGIAWLGGAMLVTQAVYAAALLSATTVRTVSWRGVRYQIDAPFRIRLIDDRPFSADPTLSREAKSL